MPIKYSVSDNGHFIHAIASAPVTKEDFVEYEVDHAVDERISSPVSELLEIKCGSMQHITNDDISKVLECRKNTDKQHTRHRCAIAVPCGEDHDWDIAKFYERMTILHSPEVVIVFGDSYRARRWLGYEND